MKAVIIWVILLSGIGAFAQGPVDACIIVNGQLNPVNKLLKVCDPSAPAVNDFNFITNNCSVAPGNSSFTTYTIIYDPQGTNQYIYTNASAGNFSDNRSGWYKVIINFDDGSITASDTDSVNISFFPLPPTIAVGGTDVYTKCPSAVLALSVNITTLNSYKWFRNVPPYTALSNTANLTFDISNTITSPFNNSYLVEAFDNNGCKTTDDFNIIAQTPPTVTLGADLQRCESNTTSFTIQNTSHSSNTGINSNPNYIWQGGPSKTSLSNITVSWANDLSITFNTAPIVGTPQDQFLIPTSDYYVVASAASTFTGCVTYDTLLIDIIEIPTPVCSNDTLICFGGTATISSTLTGGLPPYTYSWDNGAGTNASAAVTPVSTTVYTLTITDSSPCGYGPQTDNVTVNVNPEIIANAGPDQLICFEPASTANLSASATGGAGSFSYSWAADATLSSTIIPNPVASPTVTKTYNLTVTDASNCTDGDNVVINVYTPDIGNIPFPVIVSEGKPITIDIGTAQNAGLDFEWTNLNTATVISTSPSFEAKFFGEDTIKYEIVVTDANYNCIGRDTAIVWYISDNTILYVPNIFSPSAELDDNKRLKVFGDNISDDGFRFAIFNKWGQTVWETTSVVEAHEGWDGGPQIEGVYTYIVEGKFKNDKPVTESEEYMGTFKLSK